MALPSPCSPACGSSGVLAGVVAYVEVWSSNRTENYSKTFSQQLLNLGAKISKTFNKLVTHVVFKDGHQATWDKAIKSKVKLVSVLWVEKCRELGSHVDESLYLPINTNDGLAHVLKKKRKCMQPKDFVERTPENDRRLARRFDKLSKELDEQKSAFDAPVLLFDDSGELMYSPQAVVDRCSAMEKRIKEMKDKREHLSPTASQMSQTFDFTSLQPSLGNSPTVVGISLQDDNTERDLNTSYDELCVGAKTPEEAPSQKNKKDMFSLQSHSSISNNRRLVNMTSKENRFSDSHLQKKDHDLEQKCKVPAKEISRSGDDLSTETLHTKKEMPNFVCSTFATKHIADSKGKYDTKKFGSPSLELNKRTSKNANMMKELAKPPVPSADCDSEDSCFEDYFTSFSSSSCKSRRVRFSLGSFPLKHSSSPQQASKSKRLRLSEDFECDNSTIKKSRTKTTPTGIDFVNNAQSLISPEILPNLERCHASSKKVRASNRRTSCHQKKGAESPTTLHMKASEVVLNGHDKLKRTPTDPTKLSDTVLNICHVKGLDDTLQVMPGDLEPKNERLKMAANTVLEKQEDKTSSKQSAERTPAFDTIDGLSDMFNEQQNKGALESRKTNKTKKASRSLVMTSMSSEKQNTVIQVLKTFGGFILEDNVCDTTTHVIAGSPRRTLNTLLGLARGCWILSYDWVLWSLETGYWIPEEPFELSDDFPGASIYRLQRHQSAGKYQQDLFSTLPTIFISPRSQPPCDKLSEIVLLCGGKVSKTLRQAKICVGDFSGRKPFDMRSVSEKWLLDSVTKHKVLPLEDYLFQGEKQA